MLHPLVLEHAFQKKHLLELNNITSANIPSANLHLNINLITLFINGVKILSSTYKIMFVMQHHKGLTGGPSQNCTSVLGCGSLLHGTFKQLSRTNVI